MKVPIELRRSSPREVTLSGLGRAHITIAVVLLAAAPILGTLVYVFGRGVPPAIALTLFLGLGAVGAALVGSLRRQRELLSSGRAAVARVTSSRKVNQGKHQGQEVSYEFTILSGAMRTGKYYVEKNSPAPGAALIVLYEAENPSRSVRYPPSLVRLPRT